MGFRLTLAESLPRLTKRFRRQGRSEQRGSLLVDGTTPGPDEADLDSNPKEKTHEY
jgi:hypothetical protein